LSDGAISIDLAFPGPLLWRRRSWRRWSRPLVAGFATALAGRIVKIFGQPFSAAGNLTHLFPAPEILADANLASIGMPGARAETIRALARAVCDGRINFDTIVDSDAFLTRLCEIPGIGKWTAQYVAMRALGEPDAFPSGDLGLLRALAIESSAELERRAESWRPWRAVWRCPRRICPRGRASSSRIRLAFCWSDS
jgi:3-methyladenine DNA glycosylase/8-oxoguanine DNA glycosylase